MMPLNDSSGHKRSHPIQKRRHVSKATLDKQKGCPRDSGQGQNGVGRHCQEDDVPGLDGGSGFARNRLCKSDHLEIIMMTLIIIATSIYEALTVPGSGLSILFPCTCEGWSIGVPIFQLSESGTE